MGFPVNTETQVGEGIDFLNEYFNHIESIRNNLTYDIDGVVFKINFINFKNNLVKEVDRQDGRLLQNLTCSVNDNN